MEGEGDEMFFDAPRPRGWCRQFWLRIAVDSTAAWGGACCVAAASMAAHRFLVEEGLWWPLTNTSKAGGATSAVALKSAAPSVALTASRSADVTSVNYTTSTDLGVVIIPGSTLFLGAVALVAYARARALTRGAAEGDDSDAIVSESTASNVVPGLRLPSHAGPDANTAVILPSISATRTTLQQPYVLETTARTLHSDVLHQLPLALTGCDSLSEARFVYDLVATAPRGIALLATSLPRGKDIVRLGFGGWIPTLFVYVPLGLVMVARTPIRDSVSVCRRLLRGELALRAGIDHIAASFGRCFEALARDALRHARDFDLNRWEWMLGRFIVHVVPATREAGVKRAIAGGRVAVACAALGTLRAFRRRMWPFAERDALIRILPLGGRRSTHAPSPVERAAWLRSYVEVTLRIHANKPATLLGTIPTAVSEAADHPVGSTLLNSMADGDEDDEQLVRRYQAMNEAVRLLRSAPLIAGVRLENRCPLSITVEKDGAIGPSDYALGLLSNGDARRPVLERAVTNALLAPRNVEGSALGSVTVVCGPLGAGKNTLVRNAPLYVADWPFSSTVWLTRGVVVDSHEGCSTENTTMEAAVFGALYDALCAEDPTLSPVAGGSPSPPRGTTARPMDNGGSGAATADDSIMVERVATALQRFLGSGAVSIKASSKEASLSRAFASLQSKASQAKSTQLQSGNFWVDVERHHAVPSFVATGATSPRLGSPHHAEEASRHRALIVISDVARGVEEWQTAAAQAELRRRLAQLTRVSLCCDVVIITTTADEVPPPVGRKAEPLLPPSHCDHVISVGVFTDSEIRSAIRGAGMGVSARPCVFESETTYQRLPWAVRRTIETAAMAETTSVADEFESQRRDARDDAAVVSSSTDGDAKRGGNEAPTAVPSRDGVASTTAPVAPRYDHCIAQRYSRALTRYLLQPGRIALGYGRLCAEAWDVITAVAAVTGLRRVPRTFVRAVCESVASAASTGHDDDATAIAKNGPSRYREHHRHDASRRLFRLLVEHLHVATPDVCVPSTVHDTPSADGVCIVLHPIDVDAALSNLSVSDALTEHVLGAIERWSRAPDGGHSSSSLTSSHGVADALDVSLEGALALVASLSHISHVADVAHAFGTYLMDVGRCDLAKKCFAKALDLRQQLTDGRESEADAATAADQIRSLCATGLSTVYDAVDDAERAKGLSLLRKAVATVERRAPKSQPSALERAACWDALGWAVAYQNVTALEADSNAYPVLYGGEPVTAPNGVDEGMELLERALSTRMRAVGDGASNGGVGADSAALACSLYHVGAVAVRSQLSRDRGLELLLRSIDMRQRLTARGHCGPAGRPWLGESAEWASATLAAGQALCAEGNPRDATPLLQSAVAVWRRLARRNGTAEDGGHPQLAQALAQYGVCLSQHRTTKSDNGSPSRPDDSLSAASKQSQQAILAPLREAAAMLRLLATSAAENGNHPVHRQLEATLFALGQALLPSSDSQLTATAADATGDPARDEGYRVLQEAISLHTNRVPAHCSAPLANTMRHVGRYLHRRGDDSGLTLLMDALDMERTVRRGKDHPDFARALRDVGCALCEMNPPMSEDGATYLLDALEMQRRMYRDAAGHEELALTLVALGRALEALERTEEAAALLAEAYRMKERLGGRSSAENTPRRSQH